MSDINKLKIESMKKTAGIFDFIEEQATEFLKGVEARADAILKTVEGRKPTEILVKTPTSEVLVTQKQHYYFPLITTIMASPEVNLALTGECGSGKTRMVMEAAKALKLNYRLQSFNIMSTKSDIAGYLDANGKYQRSSFVRCFEDGDVFIADEFDCCSASVATFLNGAIANKVITLPTGELVEAHKDFRFVAIMNTVGNGADQKYVGREQLDAATLDRFAIIEIPYDWGLIASIVGGARKNLTIDVDMGGVAKDAEQLIKLIEIARNTFSANRFTQVISPRALLTARALSDLGVGIRWVVEACITKGLNEQQRKMVHKEIGSLCEQIKNEHTKITPRTPDKKAKKAVTKKWSVEDDEALDNKAIEIIETLPMTISI
jgi:cobaltochelatase CobS